MPDSPQALNDSTVAAYYLYGVEAGLFPHDCAKDWAYGIVAKLEKPPIEIIGVATANRRDEAMCSLSAAAEGADLPLAGAKLLSAIHQALESGRVSLRSAIRMSMQVATSTSMPEAVYFAFDGLDDELTLVASGAYGSERDVQDRAMRAFLLFGAPADGSFQQMGLGGSG